MALNTNIYVPASFNNSGITIVNADSTNLKTLFTAGVNGSDIRGIAVTSDDSTARNLALYQTIGGTDYLIGTINIPINSGADGTVVSVNALNSTQLSFLKLDNAGNRVLSLMAGGILKGKLLVAATSGKTITVVTYGVDY